MKLRKILKKNKKIYITIKIKQKLIKGKIKKYIMELNTKDSL